MNRTLLTLGFVVMLRGIAAAQANPVVENEPSGNSASSDHPAPYAKLAADLGTPNLVTSAGPADKSLLQLRFVGAGESAHTWVKMTSISIAKVKPADTLVATRAIIAKFKARLEAQKHAKVTAFTQSGGIASNAFFSFVTSDGIADQGIAYSPAEGFVSVIEVAYRHGYSHRASDRALLEAVMTGR
jgi:hypothetical protein